MKKFIVTITSIILLLSFSIQTLGETVATPSVATSSVVISPSTYVINFYLSEDNTSLENLLFQQKHDISKDIKLDTSIPVKDGYTFIGWKNEAVKAGVIFDLHTTYPSFSGTPGAIVDLYAVFQPNRYTISYHGNGADNDSVYTYNHIYDESYVYSMNPYVKKSYKFLGWNTQEDGSGITIPEGATDVNYSLVGHYIKDNSEFNLYAQWEEIKVATPSNVIINTSNSASHPTPTASVQSNTSNTLSSQSTTSTQTNNNVYSHDSGIVSNVRRLNNENATTQPEVLENTIPENIETPLNNNQDTALNNRRARRTGRSRANRRRDTTTNNNIDHQNIEVQEVVENEDTNLIEPAIVNQNDDSSKNISSTNSNDVIKTPGKKDNSSNNIFGRFFNWLFKSPARTVFCLAIFIIAIMIPFIFVILLRRKKKEEDKANEQIHK